MSSSRNKRPLEDPQPLTSSSSSKGKGKETSSSSTSKRKSVDNSNITPSRKKGKRTRSTRDTSSDKEDQDDAEDRNGITSESENGEEDEEMTVEVLLKTNHELNVKMIGMEKLILSMDSTHRAENLGTPSRTRKRSSSNSSASSSAGSTGYSSSSSSNTSQASSSKSVKSLPATDTRSASSNKPATSATPSLLSTLKFKRVQSSSQSVNNATTFTHIPFFSELDNDRLKSMSDDDLRKYVQDSKNVFEFTTEIGKILSLDERAEVASRGGLNLDVGSAGEGDELDRLISALGEEGSYDNLIAFAQDHQSRHLKKRIGETVPVTYDPTSETGVTRDIICVKGRCYTALPPSFRLPKYLLQSSQSENGQTILKGLSEIFFTPEFCCLVVLDVAASRQAGELGILVAAAAFFARAGVMIYRTSSTDLNTGIFSRLTAIRDKVAKGPGLFRFEFLAPPTKVDMNLHIKKVLGFARENGQAIVSTISCNAGESGLGVLASCCIPEEFLLHPKSEECLIAFPADRFPDRSGLGDEVLRREEIYYRGLRNGGRVIRAHDDMKDWTAQKGEIDLFKIDKRNLWSAFNSSSNDAVRKQNQVQFDRRKSIIAKSVQPTLDNKSSSSLHKTSANSATPGLDFLPSLTLAPQDKDIVWDVTKAVAGKKIPTARQDKDAMAARDARSNLIADIYANSDLPDREYFAASLRPRKGVKRKKEEGEVKKPPKMTKPVQLKGYSRKQEKLSGKNLCCLCGFELAKADHDTREISGYARHLLRHFCHPDLPDAGREYKCDECIMSFARPENVRNHAKTVHSRAFSCKDSCESFDRKEAKLLHEKLGFKYRETIKLSTRGTHLERDLGDAVVNDVHTFIQDYPNIPPYDWMHEPRTLHNYYTPVSSSSLQSIVEDSEEDD